jgi:outer membrane protein assembly factor BamB
MRKEIIIIILLFILIFTSFSIKAQHANSPWPTFHGNPQRTGLSPYSTSHVDGTILWTYQTGDGIESSPAIGQEGTIYVGSHDGYLYAIRKDGTLEWKTKIGTPIPKEHYGHNISISSSPAIASDGTIYIASQDQYLHAVSPQGIEKWKFTIGHSFDGCPSPVIDENGIIYIVSNEPRLGVYAIYQNGTQKWFYRAGANMFNSPSIGVDGTIYIGIPTGPKTNKIIALNADGRKIWDKTTSLFLESTPAIADDGTIYIGSFVDGYSGAGVYAISSEGAQKWYFTTEAKEVMATPAIGNDGIIYVGDYNDDGGTFHAINPDDGTEIWHFEVNGAIGSSAAIGDDGTIYFGENKGYFYALNPDGSEKWTLKAGSISSSPAIGEDGTVYVGGNNGKLYAFGASSTDNINSEEILIIFNEGVTRDQAENLHDSHSIEYLYSSTLWESKTMKLYIPEESQYMYTETLGMDELVSYISPPFVEDEEEPDVNEQLPDEDEEDTNNTTSNEIEKPEEVSGTPGFEISIMIITLIIALLLIKKKSC